MVVGRKACSLAKTLLPRGSPTPLRTWQGSSAPAVPGLNDLNSCPIGQPGRVASYSSQPVAIIMSSDFQWSQGKAL
jgi:hypothetical protein